MRRVSLPWGTYGRWCLVVLLTALAVLNSASTADGRYVTPAAVTAVPCGAALLVRRWPWYASAVPATAATGLWGWPLLPLLLVALFDLAAHRRVRVAVGCAAAALGANLLIPPAISLWTPQQYGSTLFVLLALVAGLWVGSRRRLLKALGDQVEHLRIERALREEAARTAERSRIAAEMHDVLAHRLSLIALHTGVLATRDEQLPAPVVERLALLRTASTEALADLRDVLGALRDHGCEPAEAAPVPVLRDVAALVEQARAAGQQAELRVDGRPEEAPAAHRLAVHRLVQEALTNARKHAGGAPVRIRLSYRPPATTVEVTNAPGSPAAHAVASGFGLVGLRERVTALGGHLHAGPGGAGSWRLAARIPHPAALEQNGTPT
ncbi:MULTISPECIES: sensor histidine kinase [Streptomyces]|uniref:histidine kinase n=1 Tax=Streptomyces chartreusis NRRL 3882 TaxID=1079985 RepID=A0A2N9BCM7_STRCX|nr:MULTISPECIES: histidine kinase [Streptomyces]MYS90178.1 two-component sensor histidine kinase [Streptomyces sp. SID5464]SOR81107.1 Sensor histidine kinase DesK [Streptomyces chartreusis NRRL 3882]